MCDEDLDETIREALFEALLADMVEDGELTEDERDLYLARHGHAEGA